jgi:hypothetical protein
VTQDDVLRAIDKLKVLGGGFNLVKVGSQTLVRSVPGELNRDKNKALELAQGRGYISKKQLVEVTCCIVMLWRGQGLCQAAAAFPCQMSST